MATIYVGKPHPDSLTRTFVVAKTAEPTGYHRGELKYAPRVQLKGTAPAIIEEVIKKLNRAPVSVDDYADTVTVVLSSNAWTEELVHTIAQIIAGHLGPNETVEIHRKY